MSNLQLPFSVKITNAAPVDYWYGPYQTIFDALSNIPLSIRYNGLTVNIINDSEYWWTLDLSDNGLQKKLIGSSSTGGSNITSITGITAGGDLYGFYPNPNVSWINSYSILDNRYATGSVLHNNGDSFNTDYVIGPSDNNNLYLQRNGIKYFSLYGSGTIGSFNNTWNIYPNGSISFANNTFQINNTGKVTSGEWNGLAISDSYISSASTWNNKQDYLGGSGLVFSSSGTISYINGSSNQFIKGDGSIDNGPSLQQVLSVGNQTNTYDIILTSGDRLVVGNNRSGLSRGTFDTGRGGDNGVSLYCTVGYELNWQAGYLRNSHDNGGSTLPIYTDSEFIYSSVFVPTTSNSLITKEYVDTKLGIVTKSKSEIDTLINNNNLVPGQLYKINGVHPTLYNDGTTSGTTIFLKGLTTNKLETEGSGLFYNPKYDQNVTGYSIWSNISSWTTYFNQCISRTAAENNQWFSICYSNDLNLFVAVSIDGTNQVMTSSDGINWTGQTASENNQWVSVCYGNGIFVAVSNDGTNQVMTSSDGINWTGQTASENNNWNSVCYGDDLFVAVAYNGTNRVMTSSDGITWTSQVAAESNFWFSICYSNDLNLFVAVSIDGTNQVMTSSDGINWTGQTASENLQWVSVCYGNGIFVAVGYNGTNQVMISSDGITWTSIVQTINNEYVSVCYGDGLFVAVAPFGTNKMMTSPDGITWTSRTIENIQWKSVCFGNGLFVAVARSGTNRVMNFRYSTSSFDNNEFVIGDGGQYATLVSTTIQGNQFISISGDWTTAKYITGDNTGAITTISNVILESYSIGSKAIWGGYSWTNVNGNVGAKIDILNLDSEWTKDLYDLTNYNLVIDLIEYDYTNNWISRRKEIKSNIDIIYSKVASDLFISDYGFNYSGIAVSMFGNPYDYNNTGTGIKDISVNDGYNENINFIGSRQYNILFQPNSSQYNILFQPNSSQYDITFGYNSYQNDITFNQNSYQQNITFNQGSNQYNISFDENSSQYRVSFEPDSSQGNLTFGRNSSQYNITFGKNSSQYNITFGQNSYQSNLTFGQNSFQSNLTFGQNSNQTAITILNNCELNWENLTFLGTWEKITYGVNEIICNRKVTFNNTYNSFDIGVIYVPKDVFLGQLYVACKNVVWNPNDSGYIKLDFNPSTNILGVAQLYYNNASNNAIIFLNLPVSEDSGIIGLSSAITKILASVEDGQLQSGSMGFNFTFKRVNY